MYKLLITDEKVVNWRNTKMNTIGSKDIIKNDLTLNKL